MEGFREVRDADSRKDNRMLDELEHFYCPAGRENLFSIWERDGALGDSTTPSISSGNYRQFITATLGQRLERFSEPSLLSLGCGNGFVESGFNRQGIHVLAVDALAAAVETTRAKGVTAVLGDVRNWTPPRGDWSVIYADGLIGHLVGHVANLAEVFARVRKWLADGGALVVSNDAPRVSASFEAAPGVDGFHWVSSELIEREMLEAEFAEITSTSFAYPRPLSGTRERVIVVGTVKVPPGN